MQRANLTYQNSSETLNNPLELLSLGVLGGINGTAGLPSNAMVIRFPSAVPMNLMPLLMRSPEIAKADLTFLSEAVFSSDILNDTVVDSSSVIITFRGRPTVSVAETFQKAKQRIDTIPGLRDRVRLFVLPEYRLPDPKRTQLEKYSGSKFEAVFVVFPKEAAPLQSRNPLEGPLAGIAALASLATCFLYAVDLNSYNNNFVQRALAGDDTVAASVLPIGTHHSSLHFRNENN